MKIVSVSPPHRSVRPIDRRKSVSPEKSVAGFPSRKKHVEPGLCPGVWRTESEKRPTGIDSPSANPPSGGSGASAESPKKPACSGSKPLPRPLDHVASKRRWELSRRMTWL